MKMKKTLSAVLAVLMLITLTCSVFAGPTVNANYGVGGFFGFIKPVEEDEDVEIKSLSIGFVDGENHTLTAKDGTTTLEDGTVVVVIKETDFVGTDVLPENTGDDAYYKPNGYYIMDDKAQKVAIDPTTYDFTDLVTYVYTEVEDTWVPYSDMKQDRSDWYYRYVRDLSIAGVVNGYPDGTFNPQGNVKWGEALKLITLATGFEAQAATDEHWASGYLAFAKENGFIAADAEIDLEAAITRQDYATVAAKALGLEAVEIETPFADSEDGYILALYEAKIVEGSIVDEVRYFKPENNITRAEMSTVIWRINQLGK